MTELVVHHHSPSPSSHHPPFPSSPRGFNTLRAGAGSGGRQRQGFGSGGYSGVDGDREEEGGDQVSLLEVLVTALRKSVVGCSVSAGGGGGGGSEEGFGMEIGLPTDVRHVAHVTFDRFDGFLGLPVEFEPEVPRRAPSARIILDWQCLNLDEACLMIVRVLECTTVFGVSTDSMQLSYDPRGNSVPTILLLMQRHLYAQGGLQAEGIFRINADNGQEEHARDQLNRGVVPEGVDVHCLAGLIKAWFRELPTGILDSLPPEQVMQSESEEDCSQLARLLPPMEAALLDWAINLMADVVEKEHLNKMNVRNIAVVFAPNMTKMADPLTALMYAVQVMNFLKTLITRTLRGRVDPVIESLPPSLSLDPSDDIEPESASFHLLPQEVRDEVETAELHVAEKLPSEDYNEAAPQAGSQNLPLNEKNELGDSCPWEALSQVSTMKEARGRGDVFSGRPNPNSRSSRLSSRSKDFQASKANVKRVVALSSTEKRKGGSTIVSRMSSRTEPLDTWR